MREFQMIQGSPEWFQIRSGRPTGSEFSRIITPAKGEYAAGADSYAADLIAESLGWRASFQGTPDTQRGQALEKEALRWLSFEYGITAREVGFCLSDCGRYGASPDGLLEDGTPVEVKSPDLHTFLKWRIKGGLPQDHKVQVHAEMAVTGAKRCVFVAYAEHPALDKIVIEVPRDAFTDLVLTHINTFCDRLEKLRVELLGEEADFYKPTIPTQTAA